VLFPQARRTLQIGEQKGDRSSWQHSHWPLRGPS
jgi:hypothetical protein